MKQGPGTDGAGDGDEEPAGGGAEGAGVPPGEDAEILCLVDEVESGVGEGEALVVKESEQACPHD